MRSKCSECIYWTGTNAARADDKAECRFNPPVASTRTVEANLTGGTGGTYPDWSWPLTKGFDWCGQFKPRVPGS